MKAFKVDRNSWHFKLVRGMSEGEWAVPRDICAYTRRLIMGILVCAFLAVLACLAVYGLVVLPLVWIAAGLISQVFMFTELMIIPAVIYGAALVKLLLMGIEKLWFAFLRMCEKNHKYEPYVEKEPGFITTAYRSFKDKFCMRIEIV